MLTRRVLPLVMVLVSFAALAGLAALPLRNFDTYFHLRFGEEFRSGHWSLWDPGSVTTYGTADWVPTQWLPQVVMAQLDRWFGLAGVAWLSGLLFLSLALTFYLVARRWADPVVAAPVMMVGLLGCAAGMSMRPQVISYVLVAVTAAVWLRTRETGRTPWLLVPLTWVWAMCHGMWPVGVVIGVVVVVGMGLDRRAGGRALLRHLAVPGLSLLTSFLTPAGPGLLSAVLLVNSRGQYFSEWGPPTFTHSNTLAVLLLLAVIVVPALRAGHTDWTTILLVALATAWTVYSIRTVPVAAALVVPLAAASLQSLLGGRTSTARPERLVVLGGYAAALVVLALVVPHTADEPPTQPVWVDSTLGAMPAGTKVLDSSVFGGYLMWRYPQLDLVASGYGDLYTTPELRRNYDIESVRDGWLDLVRDTGVQYAVVDPDSSLGYSLREVAGWSVVQDDDDLQLLRPPPTSEE